LRHIIARNAADGGYTKKFVAHNVAEVGRDSTAAILPAILRATNFGMDTRCESAIARNIARNIAPYIRTLSLWRFTMLCMSNVWVAFTVRDFQLIFAISLCFGSMCASLIAVFWQEAAVQASDLGTLQ